MKHPSLQALVEILRDRGQVQYGDEAVSQLAHALQCATLAEQQGSSPALISACLLHDIGHLLHDLGDDVAQRGIDDRHEYRAIPVLRKLFPDAVTEPIRMHVEAKRYLCAVDERYWPGLSAASKHSLELQGGTFSPAAAAAFMERPHAQDAVQLRQWDDLAKVVDAITPGLDHFAFYLTKCLLQNSANGA